MPHLDFANLEASLRTAVTEGWISFKRTHPDHHVYGLGLYTDELVEYVGMTVFSDLGLRTVLGQYATDRSAEESGPTSEVALKWSPCDSPHHMWSEESFASAQCILNAEADRDEECAQRALDVLVGVLRALDDTGLFGPHRREMILSVWMGDQSDDARVDFVRKLNPPLLAERFEADLRAVQW